MALNSELEVGAYAGCVEIRIYLIVGKTICRGQWISDTNKNGWLPIAFIYEVEIGERHYESDVTMCMGCNGRSEDLILG
jgi:hypothetical protein